MESVLDRLINQLDTLIPFIATSYEEVFQLLNKERAVWFSIDESKLPRAYKTYRKQINHAALILGYSYFENYLNDLLEQILKNRPSMLPNNKSIKYSEILRIESIDVLINEMIKKELTELFYKSMSDIINILKEKYSFTFSQDEEEIMCKFSLIRNCIIHNSSKANEKLSIYNGYKDNEEFEISSSEIHCIGLKIRALVRKMYSEAIRNHLSNGA